MEQQEFQLQHHLRILWRWKWLIALTTLVALGSGWAFAADEPARPTTYEAAAAIVLRQPSAVDNPALAQAVPDVLGDRGLQTHIRLMRSRNVLERAAAKLESGSDTSSPLVIGAHADALRTAIDIRPVGGTDLLEIKAQAPSPALAEQRANAVVEAYVDYIRETRTQAIQDALESTRESLANAQQPGGLPPESADVLATLDRELMDLAAIIELSRGELAPLEGQLGPEEESSPLPGIGRRIEVAIEELDLASRSLLRLEASAESNEVRPSMASVLESLDEVLRSLRTTSAQLQYVSLPEDVVSAEEDAPSAELTRAGLQLDGAHGRLQRAVGQVRTKIDRGQEVAPNDRELLADELRTGATVLGILAGDLLSLGRSDIDALASGQLLTAESRLRDAAAGLSLAIVDLGRLDAPAVGVEVERIRAVRARIQQGITNLNGAVTLLLEADENTQIPQAARALEVLSEEAVRLDVAIRQLSALGGGADPLARAEIDSLAELVRARHGVIASAVGSLRTLAETEEGPESSAPDFVTDVRGRLRYASDAVRDASAMVLTVRPSSSEEGGLEIFGELQARLEVAHSVMGGIVLSLEELAATAVVVDRTGRLLLVAERVGATQARLADISQRLREARVSQGPDPQELLRVQHDLELLLLRPQDTGISLVDPAEAVPLARATTGPLGAVNTKILLGALGGLLLGILAALSAEYLDRRVRTEERLRLGAGLHPLGVVPRLSGAHNPHPPMATAEPSSVFSEALQLLTTRVDKCLSGGSQALLVTSPGTGDGKTTMAINLAQLLARRHRKALLVDANLRKGDIAKALALEQRDGLGTALAQSKDTFEFIVPSSGLYVLPSGEVASNPVELLSSAEMTSFLDRARQEFDVIVVDGAPVLGFAETHALAKQVGMAILVVNGRSSSIDATRQSREDLEAAGAVVVGGIINKASPSQLKHLRHKGYAVRPTEGGSSNGHRPSDSQVRESKPRRAGLRTPDVTSSQEQTPPDAQEPASQV